MKYAPSTSENLYAMWSDDRGLWLSQMVYPEGFETAEFEVPDLSENLEEKAEALVEKMEEAHDQDAEIVNDQREKIEDAVEKKMAGESLDVEAEQENAEEEELEDELEAVL